MMSKTDILRFIFSPFLGKKIGQNFFEQLYLFAIKGRHFGGGSVIENSGELFVMSYIQDKMIAKTIFDVGANIGEYSKRLVEKFPQAAIYSFEPIKKVFDILNAKHLVEAFNFGFSDKPGRASIFIHNRHTVASSLYRENLEGFKVKVDEVEEIELQTIDGFCDSHNIASIGFLKIDTEGHEMAVLAGASNIINRGGVQFIQFEIGRTSINARVFFKDFYDLLNKNYHIYRLLKNGLQPVTNYKETDEIFMTTNFLAELKK